MDIVGKSKRSAMMAAVRGKNTKPELRVRQALHAAGYRFRLHRRDLAGRPDIVLSKHKLAIFVHGCFWHRHRGCKKCTTPTTRSEFWNNKFTANVERDRRNVAALVDSGWRVEVIWECQTTDAERLSTEILPRFKLGQLRKCNSRYEFGHVTDRQCLDDYAACLAVSEVSKSASRKPASKRC